MTDSQQLLSEYAQTGSEAAFHELVQRYVTLVYSAAVRQTGGDRHLAEDIAQEVFTDLAAMAGRLSGEVKLGGWLHRHTCFVASKALRRERRRRYRERQAAQMNALEDPTQTGYQHLTPVLDEAVNQLSTADRLAIILRFFEGRDLRAVGQALATNEDAAQKRVARALEKLRLLLRRRGVTLSGAALVSVLATQTTTAVPPGLAAGLSAAAIGAAGSHSVLTLSLLNLMAETKLNCVIGALLVVGMGASLVWEHHGRSVLREENNALRTQVEQLTSVSSEEPPAASNNNPPAVANTGQVPSEQAREVLRLRGEVTRLRQLNQELERAQAESGRHRANPQVALPPEQFLHLASWGSRSCAEIAGQYSESWLTQITNARAFLKLGMALYDSGRYPEALTVFQTMEKANEDDGAATIWQGHLLDLMGRREEALDAYHKAEGRGLGTQHSQYGLVLNRDYLRQRLETPFSRVENRDAD